MKVNANIEIASGDEMRVRPLLGGGFVLLIGPPGQHQATLTFPDVNVAETLAWMLTTSAVAHGPLGQAVAATADKVVPFPSTRPTETPPSAA